MALALSKKNYADRASTEEVGFLPIEKNFVANCTVMDAYLYQVKKVIKCHLALQVEEPGHEYNGQFLFYEMFVTFANGEETRNGKITVDYSNLCRILQKDIAELDQQSMLKKIWLNGVQQDWIVEELPDLVGASAKFWIEALRTNKREEVSPGNWSATEEVKWKNRIFYVGKELSEEAKKILPIGGYTDEYQDVRPYVEQVAA